jgi:hypothetical protein
MRKFKDALKEETEEYSMLYKALIVVLVLLALVVPSTSAQDAPAAKAADVESIDAIMKAAYDVISGAAGEKRDWDRFRSLFLPEAQLIPSSPKPEGEGFGYLVMSPEDFVTGAGSALEKDGFYEQEIHRVVEQFGHIAHVFSTYESRRSLDDAEPFARGINSFQLMNDGKRWWIVSIYWTAERPDLPIPKKYLP